MIIKYIELNNIGLYKNKRIDFSSNTNKEVILIWGNNGAGKTTFINAIKAGIFGRKGYSISFDEYCELIKNTLISSRVNKNNFKASIKIALAINDYNKEKEYIIHRSWSQKEDEFLEKVDVYLDGMLLDYEKKDLFLSKISKRLPASLLDIIIFDGEKVINIINEGNMNILIKSILYSVFGLDTYVQLYKDLNSYIKNTMYGNESSSEETLRYLKLESNYKSLYSKKNKIEIMLKEEENRRQTFARQTLQLINKFVERTGIDINDISEINETLIDVEKRKEQMNAEIRFINEEVLPLKLVHARIKRIIMEAEAEKPYIVLKKISDLKEFFSYSTEATELVNSLEKYIDIDVTNLKYELSEMDSVLLKYTDVMLAHYSKESLLKNFDKKNNLIDEIKKKISISDKISDSESEKTLSALECSYNELLKTKVNLENLTRELEICTEELNEVKEYYSAAKLEISNKKKGSNAYLNAILYRNAIEEFINKIIENTCQKLNKNILYSLQKMGFRNDSISEVTISPKTFEISLYEKDNRLIQSKLFSAGEKQLLLGLIIKESLTISKINNFFMFDTPVGRLDAKNRRLFTEEVIFKAADQVAIFATDTDYSKDDYLRIKDNITKEMILIRDDEDNIVMRDGSIF